MATAEYDPVKSVAKSVGINLVVRAITWGIITTLPFLLVLLTAVIGYLQTMPLVYIIVAATFVFASASTGLLRIAELRARISTVNKLSFQGPFVAASFIKDKKGNSKSFDQVQIGVFLHNSADFPMSYYVETIESSFESTVNSKPNRKFRGTVISARTSTIFKDASIDCKKILLDKTIYDGHIKIKVKYGLPGWERHFIEQDININFGIDPKSGFLAIAGSSDRVQ